MKRYLLAPLLLTSCLDDSAITVDDVIPSFEVVTPEANRVADGHAPIEIRVCRTDDDGISNSINATLVTSAGMWSLADSDPKVATVKMSSPCELVTLTPPTDAGTIVTRATIDTYARTLPISVNMSPISVVRLARQGELSTTESSTLTLTAHLDVAENGKPSTNTLVTFAVAVQTPAGGTAWFSKSTDRVEQGASSVETLLFVGEGVTRLTVTATASPDGQTPRTSEPLVITP
jgi:hypothetical protein